MENFLEIQNPRFFSDCVLSERILLIPQIRESSYIFACLSGLAAISHNRCFRSFLQLISRYSVDRIKLWSPR